MNAGIQVFILLIIFILPRIKKQERNQFFLWKNLSQNRGFAYIILIQLGILSIFYLTFQVEYFIDNNITTYQVLSNGIKYGYFGEGNINQFTRVSGFSIPWLIERLSYNIPFYLFNFTQLIGFVHFAGEVNNIVSFLVVVMLLSGMIYFWLKKLKNRDLTFLYYLGLFILMIAPILLWGETYFVLYRWTYPLLVIIIPPVYIMFNDILKKLQSKIKLRKVAKKTDLCLIPLLILTLIGSTGFIIVIMFHDASFLWNYTASQFFGISP
jgi:hypothetical protein